MVTIAYRQKTGLLPEQAEKFTMIPSAGVTAVVNGKTVRAGNLKLLEDMAAR